MRRNAADFNCQTCRERHCDEEGKLPGSKGRAGYPKYGDGRYTCPLPEITSLSRTFLSLHTHYKSRLLPLSGGLLNQPNAYLQAMELIESQ